MNAEDKKKLIEKLAEIEHRQWEHWAKSVKDEVSEERRARWEGYMVPYDQLDETTKDMDRKWAEEAFDEIAPHFEKSAKELVTRFEVDSAKYPHLAKLNQE